jgi:CCR4-NOT transcription complex subunit 7/8
MLRVLLGHDLPDDENRFFELMNNYFCNYFDIKEVKREIEYLSGGLNKVAKELAVDRVGTMHQAGSDSIVTRGVYFKLKELYKKWWSNGENEAIME